MTILILLFKTCEWLSSSCSINVRRTDCSLRYSAISASYQCFAQVHPALERYLKSHLDYNSSANIARVTTRLSMVLVVIAAIDVVADDDIVIDVDAVVVVGSSAD